MHLYCEKIRNTSAAQANTLFLGRKRRRNNSYVAFEFWDFLYSYLLSFRCMCTQYVVEDTIKQLCRRHGHIHICFEFRCKWNGYLRTYIFIFRSELFWLALDTCGVCSAADTYLFLDLLYFLYIIIVVAFNRHQHQRNMVSVRNIMNI